METVDQALRKIIDRDCAWEFGRDYRTRSHEHQMSYRLWRVFGLVLNISAALFAIAAGATLITQLVPGSTGEYIAGGFGVLSALITSASAYFRADSMAEKTERAAVHYDVLATSYFDLESKVFASPEDIAQRLETLNREVADVMQFKSPIIVDLWAKSAIRRQIAKKRLMFPKKHSPTLDEVEPAFKCKLAALVEQSGTASPDIGDRAERNSDQSAATSSRSHETGGRLASPTGYQDR